MIGKTVSHYRIIEKLGSGGMGVVYKAEDTALGRQVAVKFLPEEWTEDRLALERFQREARAAAALNHPNICTIYEVGEYEGQPFLAMELLEGETLEQRLSAQPLKVNEILELAIPIAMALEAAHAKGVVHRDIKPANIFVTQEGGVKILDFGLAKVARAGGPSTVSVAPTGSLTAAGDVVGTVHYMSPEQALGEPVDGRTDLFSFGSVLFEMATGRAPFLGSTLAETLAHILQSEPEAMGRFNSEVPAELERITRKCLEKKREARYQTAKELRVELQGLKRATESGQAGLGAGLALPKGAQAGVPLRKRLIAAIAGATIILVLAVLIAQKVHKLGPVGPPRIESLAVLPIKNFSGDPAQDFFADGMTDALIAGLAQIKAVKVISRTSVMHYKGTNETLPQIAGELGVDGIIEASVMRSGGRVRVTAQLLDARQDRHLWANNYEREMTDVLALQSDVVQAIADEIRVQVTPQESQRLKTARTVDAELYDTILKGRATLEYATREEQIRQAIELFQKAVDRDPTYAPAWAGLGQALWELAGTGLEFVAPGEVRDKAIAAAERALQLDGNLPEAHEARALIAWDAEWDIANANRHFERALELRPGDAATHGWYAQMLVAPLGRFEEARQHLDRARELDPLSPWNDINLISWWNFQGRPEKALEEGERALRRNPVSIISGQMGDAHVLLEQPSHAVSDKKAVLKLLQPERPPSALAGLGLAYGLAGRRADALKILAEMEQASKKRYVSPFYLAVVYSGLGRMEEAFRLLDQALRERTPYLADCVPYDANSVALRRDPRWKPFIARLRRLVRLPPGIPDPYS